MLCMLSCGPLLAKLRLFSICQGPSGPSTTLGQNVTANMPPSGRRGLGYLRNQACSCVASRLGHENIVMHGVKSQGLCGMHGTAPSLQIRAHRLCRTHSPEPRALTGIRPLWHTASWSWPKLRAGT